MACSCGTRPCALNQRCVPHSEDQDGPYDCIDSTKEKSATVMKTGGGPRPVLTSAGEAVIQQFVKNKPAVLTRIKESLEGSCYDVTPWKVEENNCRLNVNRDCTDILQINPGAKNGQYTIVLPKSQTTLSVYCDMETDGGGWTVFQRRFNGETDFYRNYREYESGFGTVSGEFWLGLKNIQELANQGVSELRIDIASFDGTTGYESFQDFKLVDPDYTLQLHSTTPNSGPNGLLYSNNSGFTTYDHDVNKDSKINCALDRKGAWWYRPSCSHMNLNGLNSAKYPCMRHNGLAYRECLKSSRLMFRRTA